MKARKLLSFVLVLAMLLSTGVLTAFAADTLEIEAETKALTLGEASTVSVAVNATANPGFVTGEITFDWDSGTLELTGVTYDGFVPNNGSPTVSNTGTYKVTFGSDLVESNYTATGKMFTLNFNISSEATTGTYPIAMSCESWSFNNFDLDYVTANLTDGSVKLQGPDRTVKFDMGGHGTAIADKVVPDGETLTEPAAPSESGWIFKGWYKESAFTNEFDFSAAITADTTIYAKWAEQGTPTADDFTVTPPADLVYDGAAKAATVAWKDGTGTGAITVSYSADPVNAGSYDVLVSTVADANYKAATNLKVGSFTITPKAVAITGATLTARDFEEGNKDVAVSGVTFDVSLTASDYTATAAMETADAGDAKAATVTVTLNNSNYSLANATYEGATVKINKIDLPSSVKTTDSKTVRIDSAASQSYELSALPTGASYGTATASGAPVSAPSVSGTTLGFTADTSAEATATITVPITGGTNYNDGTFTLTVNVLDKDEAGVTLDPTTVTKTFGDAAFTVTKNVATPGTGTGTWTWTSSDESVVTVADGTVTVVGVGTATVTAAYESDDAAGSATVTVTVNKADATVTAPTAKTGLTYTGSEQALVEAGSATGGEIQYSLDGSTYSTAVPKGTNAGDYTVYYKVVGDANHNDVAAATVAVSIAKAVPEVEPVTVTAPATIYSSTAKDAITLSTGCTVAGTLTVEGFSATNKVVSWKFTPTDTANYEVAEGFMSVDVVEVALDKIEITTQPTKTTGYLYDDAGEFDYTGAVVTATYNNGDTKVLDNVNEVGWSWTWGVGTVTVTAAYEGKTDTVDITVEKATPTITAEDVEMVYTGSAAADSLISGTAVDASGEEVIGEFSFKSGQEVTKVADSGSKTVVFTPSDSECYNSVETTANLTITAKSVTVSGLTADNKEYDGTTTATVSGTPVLEGKVDGDDLDFTAGTPTFADANAGNGKQITLTGFALTGTDAGNYTLEDPAGLTANITPKAITINGADLTARDYAEGNKDVEVASVSFDGPIAALTKGTDYTATAAMADDTAGTKEATVTVTLSNGNYSLATNTYTGTVTINKINWTDTAATGEAKFGSAGTVDLSLYTADGGSYGTLNTTGAATFSADPAVSGNNLTFTFADDATVGATATVTVPVTGATNYNDYNITVTLTVLAKEAQSLSFSALRNSVVYGNTLSFAATHSTGDGDVTYASSDETVATVDASGKVTPVKAGSATITATAAETDDFAVATASYDLTVDKAALTITAKNQTITVGQDAPDLTGAYTVSGLVNDDSVDDATVAYATTPDTSAEGTVAINVSGATGTGLDNYDITYVAGTLTIRRAGGGGGGGSASTPAETSTTVATQTDAQGNITATVTEPQAASGQTLKLDTTVPAAADAADAPTITIDVPAGANNVTLEIPVENVEPGDVLVKVNPDGTEEIIPKTELTSNGLLLEVSGDTTVKVVKNDKHFVDVPSGYWAERSIDFVTARGLFAGTTETTFSPAAPMTRAMLATVLYRLESKPANSVDAAFDDVAEGSWCDAAIDWASANGIVAGYDDHTFGANDPITREQLAAMLWRLAGRPAAKAVDTGCSAYAKDAMSWAVANGILQGDGAGNYNPKANATRAEVAAMLMRFINL